MNMYHQVCMRPKSLIRGFQYFCSAAVLLFSVDAFGQVPISPKAVWEQKLDILGSCTPQGAGASILAMASGENGVIYVSDPTHLYRSVDGGNTWDHPQFQIPHIQGIVPFSSDSLLIGVVSELSTDKSGVYLATAFGDNWSRTALTEQVGFMAARIDLSIIYTASFNTGLFVSKDRGQTWQETLPGSRISKIDIGYYGVDVLYPGTLKSLDGLNWEPRLPNKPIGYPTSNSDVFLRARAEGVERTMNGGWSWYPVLDAPISQFHTTLEAYYILAISDRGSVYETRDEGENWIQISESIPEACGRVNISALDHHGFIWVGTPGGAVFRTSSSVLTSIEHPIKPTLAVVDVFPLPANDTVHIRSSSVLYGNAELVVFDLRGRKVDSHILNAANDELLMDVSHYPSGMYFFRLSTKDAASFYKFIVAR